MDSERELRVYSEIMTGDWAWETQVRFFITLNMNPLMRSQANLPDHGGTLLPVLLGSDKTHLTVFAGDKKAWPLYLSLGNIKSSFRNKPRNHAWVLVAYLPVVTFEAPKRLQTVLQNRFFHQCVELVLEPLKAAGLESVKMADSLGNVRRCFPRLAAYLADYPEQGLINIARAGHSPTTIATNQDLGDTNPHPPRTREWIVNTLAEITATVDPSNIEAFEKAAKLRGMNGVHRPFWIDMPGYRPELCIAPDILHGLHRFWRDHILKWTINLVGVKELDARVKAVEPLIGTRHFKHGISHLSQWSGREDRELERILIAVIAGAPRVDPLSMRCLRQFHEFLYLAQYKSHDSDTLGYMQKALNTFHRHKRIFLINGARSSKTGPMTHFHIPKLAALHAYVGHISMMGSSPQFSTEVIETCHQTMAKLAYKSTNKRDYEMQMCRYLDRTARANLLQELSTWWTRQSRINVMEESIRGYDSDFQELARSFFAEELDAKFVKVPRRRGMEGAIWHNFHPHRAKMSLVEIALEWKLPNFLHDLHRYLSQFSETPQNQTFYSEENVDVWFNCHIHLPSVQDEEEEAAVRTVQALPPSDLLPCGRGSCVLIPDSPEAESTRIDGMS
jgi:hypothetical protein